MKGVYMSLSLHWLFRSTNFVVAHEVFDSLRISNPTDIQFHSVWSNVRLRLKSETSSINLGKSNRIHQAKIWPQFENVGAHTSHSQKISVKSFNICSISEKQKTSKSSNPVVLIIFSTPDPPGSKGRPNKTVAPRPLRPRGSRHFRGNVPDSAPTSRGSSSKVSSRSSRSVGKSRMFCSRVLGSGYSSWWQLAADHGKMDGMIWMVNQEVPYY